MTQDYSEDTLVEQPAIALFAELGWETANCFYEACGPNGALGQETPAEAVYCPSCSRVGWMRRTLI